MYLLLYKEPSKKTISWLTKNAIPIAPLCWLHNSTIEGTIPIKINNSTLKQLSSQIDSCSEGFIEFVESKIKTTLFRGMTKRLTINKLRMIVEASQSIEIVGHAKDLLIILGEDEETDSKPEEIPKDMELGIDTESVKEYLLRLAKKPSIH